MPSFQCGCITSLYFSVINFTHPADRRKINAPLTQALHLLYAKTKNKIGLFWLLKGRGEAQSSWERNLWVWDLSTGAVKWGGEPISRPTQLLLWSSCLYLRVNYGKGPDFFPSPHTTCHFINSELLVVAHFTTSLRSSYVMAKFNIENVNLSEHGLQRGWEKIDF